MIPQHLGALHPWEQALTIVLAFGPFILLGVVIAIQRRKDAREEIEEAAADEASAAEPDQPGRA